MSGKRPKGSLYACREVLAAADSHATTNGTMHRRFTPCPELEEEVSEALADFKAFMDGYAVHQVTEND